MMGLGTFLGANIPTQLDASMSGTPSSCSVFHAGLKLDRFEVVTASTRTRSDGRNGTTEEIARSPSGMSPAATAVAAVAPPRHGTWRSLLPALRTSDSIVTTSTVPLPL